MRRPRARRSAWLSALACGALAVACASHGNGAIDPRYFAVHDAFAAMGMVEVGPIQRGTLASGEETRVPLELAAGCATIVALGGDGVRDLDAALLSSDGSVVAHDATRDSQATVRACVDRAGTYAFRVKMASGSGEFLAATWSGGAPAGAPSEGSDPAEGDTRARGTCESPIPLAPGDTTGSTVHGEADNDGSCASSTSREMVYRLTLATRQRVTVETIDPKFDTLVYIRTGDCSDVTAEVEGACNDDFEHDRRSRVRVVLDPGAYFVFVDGLANERGSYTLRVALEDVPTIAEACRSAVPLAPGVEVSGDTSGSFDAASATCGEEAHGYDAPFTLAVGARSRVRLTERSGEVPPVVHVRRACVDPQTEIACSDDGLTGQDATYTGVFEPGSYTVFADATPDRAGASGGKFTLLAETQPLQGAGAPGDACGDAIPITKSGALNGDTFPSRDDVAGTCGGAGAADAVYRVDLAHKTHLAARVPKQEGHHVLVLTRACGDPAGEVACGATLDTVVAPGTYWLAVDGAKPAEFGRYELDVHLLDVGGQEAACKSASLLHPGTIVQGTSDGAGDKFTTSCAGSEDAQSSDDRVYRLDLAQRTRVSLRLATPAWDGVLAIRRSCLDGPPANEVQCNNDTGDTHHSQIDRVLDAGTYYVVIDGHMGGNAGAFTLEYRTLK